jgi:hypothetical protein
MGKRLIYCLGGLFGRSNYWEPVMEHHPGIRIDHIPAEGAGGLIFAVGMIAVVLLAMPALRPIAVLCALGGALLAPVLHRLHR